MVSRIIPKYQDFAFIAMEPIVVQVMVIQGPALDLESKNEKICKVNLHLGPSTPSFMSLQLVFIPRRFMSADTGAHHFSIVKISKQ